MQIFGEEVETGLSAAKQIAQKMSESSRSDSEDTRRSWKLVRTLTDDCIRMHCGEPGAEGNLIEDAASVNAAAKGIKQQIECFPRNRQRTELAALILEVVRELAAKETQNPCLR